MIITKTSNGTITKVHIPKMGIINIKDVSFFILQDLSKAI